MDDQKNENVLALVAMVFPPRLPSLLISTIPKQVKWSEKPSNNGTHSVVITTLQSQSLTLSLNDSALNPANTAEWTAPIRAQARKAAVACHVIGRLGVSCTLGGCSFLNLNSSPFSTSMGLRHGEEKERRKGGRRFRSCYRAPTLDLLDRNSIPLLNPPRFKYIRNLTSLFHQFPKTNFSRFGSFIRFVDDSCFFWVGVEMSV